MNPSFPIFIPSKGRADSRLTVKALEMMGVPFRVVIEEQQWDQYAAVIDKNKLLVLDKKYQEKYNTCDSLGMTKSVGPGAARNFIWDYSINEGYTWHWVMDDNIRKFYRLHKNRKIPVLDSAIFRAMEDFVGRYENVAMAGPNYFMFCPRKQKTQPLVFNTRIYSCNLIRNDLPYRWRGRYNEDTDLSLRMLKDGWCTVQFNVYLQEKIKTQMIKGGNTAEFYSKEGTLPKSLMLERMHPDVAKVKYKFKRWHHYVDYRPFKQNKLKLRPGFEIPEKYDYGMKIVKAGKEIDAGQKSSV